MLERGGLTCRRDSRRRPRRRPDHPPAPRPAAARRAHRRVKGKSTAAFGLALRAWNQGWPIGVFQFVKSAKWRVGEEKALQALGGVHEQTGEGGPVTWHKMGEGWSWVQRPGTEDDHAADAREGWEQIKRDLAAETYRFYVLDEFTYPMKWGWVDVDEVVAVLRDRPGTSTSSSPAATPPRRWSRPPTWSPRWARSSTRWTPARRASEGSSGERPAASVVAAPASGHGKTTVATGLIAALAARGLGRRRRTRSARTTSTPATTRSPPAGRAATSTRSWSARTRIAPLFAARRRGRRHRRRRGRDGPVRRRGGTGGRGLHRARRPAARRPGAARRRRHRRRARSVAALVHGFAAFDPRECGSAG